MIIEKQYDYQYPVWENGQITYHKGTIITMIGYVLSNEIIRDRPICTPSNAKVEFK